MTISDILEAGKQLVFARVVKVCTDTDLPWVIAHVIDLDTLDPVKPTRSIFLNAAILTSNYQFFQLGPFRTPHNVNLETYGLPLVGDVILGETGTNYKGEIYTSYLPDRWTRPISYFFHYLMNEYSASRLYENRDPAMRMVLLNRLTVQYGKVRDERLYDVLCLVLFDDTDSLIEMCYKPQHRPQNGRKWSLMDKSQVKKITTFLASLGGSSVHIPTVPEFVEEVAYLTGDSGICAHFKSILQVTYEEAKPMFHRETSKWLTDPECLSSELIQTLLDQNI